ncbi:MAG TPA: hypothetical protein VGU44_01885 [Gammaproteobacteria bacterium]|nr:hypothetical protein [Gammaproteobacteria bacterium]
MKGFVMTIDNDRVLRPFDLQAAREALGTNPYGNENQIRVIDLLIEKNISLIDPLSVKEYQDKVIARNRPFLKIISGNLNSSALDAISCIFAYITLISTIVFFVGGLIFLGALIFHGHRWGFNGFWLLRLIISTMCIGTISGFITYKVDQAAKYSMDSIWKSEPYPSRAEIPDKIHVTQHWIEDQLTVAGPFLEHSKKDGVKNLLFYETHGFVRLYLIAW